MQASGLQGLVEQVRWRIIPLLLESTNERELSHACMSSAERGGERRHSLQRVPEGRGSDVYITAKPYITIVLIPLLSSLSSH